MVVVVKIILRALQISLMIVVGIIVGFVFVVGLITILLWLQDHPGIWR